MKYIYSYGSHIYFFFFFVLFCCFFSMKRIYILFSFFAVCIDVDVFVHLSRSSKFFSWCFNLVGWKIQKFPLDQSDSNNNQLFFMCVLYSCALFTIYTRILI